MRDQSAAVFPSTNWTLILEGRSDPGRRRVALEELLHAYWAPLYSYARRKGCDRDAARDAVQGFLTSLLERDVIDRLDPDKGRLRSFLARSLDHYLMKLHRHDTALKRGRGATVLLGDIDAVESALGDGPLDPEQAYNRQWALTVMQRALARLRTEYEDGTRTGSFELVARFFGGDNPLSYRELADQHGMSVTRLKSLIHRARGRFRELVREEVRQTVADATQADDELETILGFGRR